jgi:ribosomal protein L11 methyltransferase
MIGFPPLRGEAKVGGTPRLTVTVPAAVAEFVAAYLHEQCGAGLQQRDAETGLGAADRVELLVWPPVELATELVFGLRALFHELRAEGRLAGRTHVELEDDPGTWARPRQVVRIAGRFVIAPPWLEVPADEGELVLSIDPSGAFGDGRHPSTALALLGLRRVELGGQPADRILDVGCGTGVLSVAAALTWPQARVVAVDLDPAAVAAATANVARLGLDGRIDVRAGSADAAEGPFDLVLANLTAGNLERVAADLAARTASGGRIVTAGYPLGSRDRIERVFAAHALFGSEADELEDWAAVTFRK